jgi:hypothetical protein
MSAPASAPAPADGAAAAAAAAEPSLAEQLFARMPGVTKFNLAAGRGLLSAQGPQQGLTAWWSSGQNDLKMAHVLLPVGVRVEDVKQQVEQELTQLVEAAKAKQQEEGASAAAPAAAAVSSPPEVSKPSSDFDAVLKDMHLLARVEGKHFPNVPFTLKLSEAVVVALKGEAEEVFIQVGKDRRVGMDATICELITSFIKRSTPGLKIVVAERGKSAAKSLMDGVAKSFRATDPHFGIREHLHNPERLDFIGNRRLEVMTNSSSCRGMTADWIIVPHAECITPEMFYNSITPLLTVKDTRLVVIWGQTDEYNYIPILLELKKPNSDELLFKRVTLEGADEKGEKEKEKSQ